ncbi:ABC-2 transporter permease [Ruminococcus flavefaciens]|uniref:ABC-2 transporter permease n=1 Tax=Ruminococcus flavefaciens TaxID=1265 RepID=UPI001565FB5A|nr:ABC-2 transporter permease [Ruminococcus flavefaciens]
MTGLVYKEWKQNRWMILSMILCGFAPVIALLIMHDEITDIGDTPIRIGGLIAGFLAAGALQMLVLRGDDRKLWGYWITATPDGYKGFLRVKYEMIFGMIVLLMFSVQFVDMGYCEVAADMGKADAVQISGIALLLCFVQILLRAIDIPFVYRFGSKRGSFVKLTCFVAAALSFSALFVIYQEKFDPFFEMGIGVFTTENSSLILSVGLVACLALYYLSYRITCKLYLKGVEQYEH